MEDQKELQVLTDEEIAINEANKAAYITEAGTQLVTLGEASGANKAMDMIDQFTGRTIRLYSSIGEDASFADRMRVFNAMNDNEGKLAKQLNITIPVQDMIAYPVPFFNDVTGELTEILRIVVIQADGTSWGTAATGIAESLKGLMQIVGKPPWTPALLLTPISKDTRKGFTTVVLRLDGLAAVTPPTAAGAKK